MAIEIVDFPIKNGGSFHSYAKLPEGTVLAHGHIGHIGNMQSLNLADLDFLIIQGNGGLGGTSLTAGLVMSGVSKNEVPKISSEIDTLW